MGSSGSYFLVLALVWQEGVHLSALQAGLAFLSMGAVFALVSVHGGHARQRLAALALIGSVLAEPSRLPPNRPLPPRRTPTHDHRRDPAHRRSPGKYRRSTPRAEPADKTLIYRELGLS